MTKEANEFHSKLVLGNANTTKYTKLYYIGSFYHKIHNKQLTGSGLAISRVYIDTIGYIYCNVIPLNNVLILRL